MDVQKPEMDGFEATQQIRVEKLANMECASNSGAEHIYSCCIKAADAFKSIKVS